MMYDAVSATLLDAIASIQLDTMKHKLIMAQSKGLGLLESSNPFACRSPCDTAQTKQYEMHIYICICVYMYVYVYIYIYIYIH